MRGYKNYPRSMLCAHVKIPLAIGLLIHMVFMGCHKNILFVAGGASIDGEYVVFLIVLIPYVEGDISTLSRWTILDPSIGTTILYITPNWSGGRMLTLFTGVRYPFNAQWLLIFMIYG